MRTFEVETQLSKEKKDSICIVPELSGTEGADICFLDFVDKDATLWVKDLLWVRERIQVVHDEAVSPQALKAYEGEQMELMNLSKKLIDGAEFTVRALDFFRVDFGHKALGTPQARLSFETSVQPIFHKNFDLVASSFTDFLQRKYRLYICSDSMKQTERLKDIFKERGDDITFEQIKKQLNRMVEVIKVIDFTNTFVRMKEILYIKVFNCSSEDKVELFQIAETFKARVIDYGKDSLLLEFVQTATKNDAVVKLIKEEFGRIEVVRGGSVGIESISMMER